MVREPDGTLRKANEDERHAVNQIYFPQSGRELKHPVMFDDANLKVIVRNAFLLLYLNCILKYSLFLKMVIMNSYWIVHVVNLNLMIKITTVLYSVLINMLMNLKIIMF